MTLTRVRFALPLFSMRLIWDARSKTGFSFLLQRRMGTEGDYETANNIHFRRLR